MLGSVSSFTSDSSRIALRASSKMLLELEDLLQQVLGAIQDLLHQWPWQFLKRFPLPQGQMSLRPTPAKFHDTGFLNAGMRPAAGVARAAVAVPSAGAWGGRATSLTGTGLAAAAAFARWLFTAAFVSLGVAAFFLDIGVTS